MNDVWLCENSSLEELRYNQSQTEASLQPSLTSLHDIKRCSTEYNGKKRLALKDGRSYGRVLLTVHIQSCSTVQNIS